MKTTLNIDDGVNALAHEAGVVGLADEVARARGISAADHRRCSLPPPPSVHWRPLCPREGTDRDPG